MKEKIKRVFKSIPKAFYILLSLALSVLILHLIAIASTAFADRMNGSVSHVLRAALAYVTSVFPFSLAELFVVGIPLWILLLILLVRRLLRGGKSALRICCAFLGIIPVIYMLFAFTMGMGYAASPLSERLSLDTGERITAEELYDTALWLVGEANAAAALVTAGEDGQTLMPYETQEMNEKLIEAYRLLSEKYGFIKTYSVGVKPILLSRPMAYTGITGVYSFFTGEANMNTAYPDFSNVYTAAHEMAHARGIARENEANFVAFLALEASDDPYLRYAAYANLLQYVINALARTDRDRLILLYENISDTVKNEYKAYNAFVDSVDDSFVRDVAEGVNNAYLQGVGTEGTVSYSLVVNLAVAYRKAK